MLSYLAPSELRLLGCQSFDPITAFLCLRTWTENIGMIAGYVEIPVGPTGPTGEVVMMGPTGANGIHGLDNMGSDDDTGCTGIPGQIGATGSTGYIRPSGSHQILEGVEWEPGRYSISVKTLGKRLLFKVGDTTHAVPFQEKILAFRMGIKYDVYALLENAEEYLLLFNHRGYERSILQSTPPNILQYLSSDRFDRLSSLFG
jgi:hypothetical protein